MRRTSCLIAVCLTMVGLLPLTTLKAHAASFDCDAKELKPDEKAICDNRALNDADVKMVTTFDLLSGLMAMGARGDLQEAQAAWLKKRQSCNGDVACLKAAYEERLAQLAESYKNINRPL